MHPRVIRSLVRGPLSEAEKAILRPALIRVNEQCRQMNEAIENATCKEWIEVTLDWDLYNLFEKLAQQRGGWVVRDSKAGTTRHVQYFFPNGKGDFEAIVKGFGAKV